MKKGGVLENDEEIEEWLKRMCLRYGMVYSEIKDECWEAIDEQKDAGVPITDNDCKDIVKGIFEDYMTENG
jgi:hypothetical protein